MIGEQRHDRRACGADGVAVSGADRAIAIEHAQHRRLLRHEALDRVGALDLGREVDEAQLDAIDDGHSDFYSRVVRGTAKLIFYPRSRKTDSSPRPGRA